MTTTDAAAAWHVQKRLTLAVTIVSAALALTGCGSTSNLFGSSGDSASQILGEAPPPPAPAATQSRVAIGNIVGAPDAVGRQISTQLTSSAERQRIAIAKSPGEPSDYTLRGFMVAAKERSGVKVSYIWDLHDQQGKRVNRYQGEEIVPGGDNRDPWASVTPQLIQTIADKTATGVGKALAGLPKGPGGDGAPPVGVGAPSDSARIASAGASSATTGSIARPASVVAVVPDVVGAPGDGKTSLAEALRSELNRNGIDVADAVKPGAYRVEGKVAVGQATGGKQPIQIDWQVKDAAGKRVGSVSQKNEIAQGSLDGSWGQTADAAAAAAAQGILKLLNKSPQSTN